MVDISHSYLSNCLDFRTNKYFLYHAEEFNKNHEFKYLKKITVLNNISEEFDIDHPKSIKEYISGREDHVIRSDSDQRLFAILDDENEVVLERFGITQLCGSFVKIDNKLACCVRFIFYAEHVLANKDLPEDELTRNAELDYVRKFLSIDDPGYDCKPFDIVFQQIPRL